jgi:hypothetical protein
MIAHDGRKICVGWSDYELLWLRAAITNGSRRRDFMDISDLSGRSYEAVRDKASSLLREALAEEESKRKAAAIVTFAARKAARNKSRIADDASAIKWPTPAQLMPGSTRVRTYNGWTT